MLTGRATLQQHWRHSFSLLLDHRQHTTLVLYTAVNFSFFVDFFGYFGMVTQRLKTSDILSFRTAK